jgi:hypothetical protein
VFQPVGLARDHQHQPPETWNVGLDHRGRTDYSNKQLKAWKSFVLAVVLRHPLLSLSSPALHLPPCSSHGIHTPWRVCIPTSSPQLVSTCRDRRRPRRPRRHRRPRLRRPESLSPTALRSCPILGPRPYSVRWYWSRRCLSRLPRHRRRPGRVDHPPFSLHFAPGHKHPSCADCVAS